MRKLAPGPSRRSHALRILRGGREGHDREITTASHAGVLAKHSVTELTSWTDHAFGRGGRLDASPHWDAATTKFLPVEWRRRFARSALTSRRSNPNAAVFYSSGRASSKPPICTPCLLVFWATTTCPTARTCATRAHRLGCARTSECRSARSRSTISYRPIVFCSSATIQHQQSAHAHHCRIRGNATCRSWFSIRFASGPERFTDPEVPAQMLPGSPCRIGPQNHQMQGFGSQGGAHGSVKANLGSRDPCRADAGGDRACSMSQSILEHFRHGFAEFATRRCGATQRPGSSDRSG